MPPLLYKPPASRLTPLASLTTRAAAARNALPRRHFHLSAVGDAVVLTADGISSIHAAGVPWYLSIPLVALGVNLSFRLPIQYYTRRLIRRRNELNPLVSAWSSRHAASVERRAGNENAAAAAGADADAQSERLWRLRVAGMTEKSRRRIYKTFGVQRWKTLAPFLSMLPFVVVSEALRRLCGAPMGWISHSVGLDKLDGAAGVGRSLFDAGLAHGGCLWFGDLTAMDPYYALPVLCSALLARTSWGRLSGEQLRALLSLDGAAAGGAPPRTPMARMRTAVGRVLLLVPLFPVLFADLPSAIFLYWATTFALNDVNEAVLERVVPKAPTRGLKMVQRIPTALPYLRGSHDAGRDAGRDVR